MELPKTDFSETVTLLQRTFGCGKPLSTNKTLLSNISSDTPSDDSLEFFNTMLKLPQSYESLKTDTSPIYNALDNISFMSPATTTSASPVPTTCTTPTITDTLKEINLNVANSMFDKNMFFSSEKTPLFQHNLPRTSTPLLPRIDPPPKPFKPMDTQQAIDILNLQELVQNSEEISTPQFGYAQFSPSLDYLSEPKKIFQKISTNSNTKFNNHSMGNHFTNFQNHLSNNFLSNVINPTDFTNFNPSFESQIRPVPNIHAMKNESLSSEALNWILHTSNNSNGLSHFGSARIAAKANSRHSKTKISKFKTNANRAPKKISFKSNTELLRFGDSADEHEEVSEKQKAINAASTDCTWPPHFHPHNQEWRVRYRYKGAMRIKTVSCKQYGYEEAQKLALKFVEKWVNSGRKMAQKTKRSRLSVYDVEHAGRNPTIAQNDNNHDSDHHNNTIERPKLIPSDASTTIDSNNTHDNTNNHIV